MIKKLLGSVREFKLFSLLSPLFVVLEVVMEVVIPILMAMLIDKGIDGDGGMDAVMHYGWILFLPDILRRLPLPALRGICGMICSIVCSSIPFPISISFLLPASLPV